VDGPPGRGRHAEHDRRDGRGGGGLHRPGTRALRRRAVERAQRHGAAQRRPGAHRESGRSNIVGRADSKSALSRRSRESRMPFLAAVVILLAILLFSTFNVLNEYERAVVFTRGPFPGIKGPGLTLS